MRSSTEQFIQARSKSARNTRSRFRRWVMLGLAFTTTTPTLIAQEPIQTRDYRSGGDLPASPWSNQNVVRTASVTQPPAKQPANTNQRPATVTLLGPVAPPTTHSNPSLQSKQIVAQPPKASQAASSRNILLRPSSGNEPQSVPYADPHESMIAIQTQNGINESANRKDPRFNTATSSGHGPTQADSSEAQSGWHHVPEEGLVLESGDVPDEMIPQRGTRLTGLPDRIPELPTTSSRTVSQSKTLPVEEPDFKIESATELTNQLDSTRRITKRAPMPIQNDFESRVSAQPTYTTDLAPQNTNPYPTPTAPNPAVTVVPPLGRGLPDVSQVDTSPQAQRISLASRVHHELLSAPPYPSLRSPEPLETPPGWNAVEQQLRLNLEKCDSLLRRGAVHSARDEAIQGLRALCRAIDAHRRAWTSEPALERGLTALRESADFRNSTFANDQLVSIQTIVDTHSTEALKGRDLSNANPEIAAQHYRAYARFQFVEASEGHRWAADLLYALGKTYEKEAQSASDHATAMRGQAVVCYQAAVQISPRQSEAYNQLGYVLLQLDRVDDAYTALRTSIEIQPHQNAWNNLAEVYRRVGSQEEAAFATQQAAAVADAKPSFSAENPEINWVPPDQFAKYSVAPPFGNNLNGQANLAVQTNPVVTTASSTAKPPVVKSSWMSKIFRK